MARLPKSIIKKYGISKKAWRVFRGKKRKTKKGKTRKSRARSKTVGRRRGFLNSASIMKYLRIAALVAPAIRRATEPKSTEIKVQNIIADYTGFQMWDGKWKWERLAQGWMPYIASVLVTYGVPKIAGIIRRL